MLYLPFNHENKLIKLGIWLNQVDLYCYFYKPQFSCSSLQQTCVVIPMLFLWEIIKLLCIVYLGMYITNLF